MTSTPRQQLTVLTCMDVRIDINALLGLEPGDAHILRNGGGIVTDDVIRSLILSQRLLGTREIALIHHTDCGLQRREALDALEVELGMKFDGFEDPAKDLLHCIAELEAHPHILGTVRGYVYDVDTGVLRAVR